MYINRMHSDMCHRDSPDAAGAAQQITIVCDMTVFSAIGFSDELFITLILRIIANARENPQKANEHGRCE